MQLFIQSARRVGYTPTDADTPSIIRICQLAEGLPLALELAAAWVRAMPCAEIAREIERSPDILTTTTRNVPDKHRSMRAAFEHSWNLLSDGEQAVFRKLSVFRGGFTREAAEAVAGATLQSLASLVDKSLLRVDVSGRYDLHELLRQYGEEQLNVSPQEQEHIHDLHCAYYAKFMQQQWEHLNGSHVKVSLKQIDQEIDNVRAVWQWAIARKKVDEIDRVLDSLWLYDDIRGRYQESEQACEDAVAMLADDGDETGGVVLAHVLVRQAWTCMGLCYWDKARALLEKGFALASRFDAYRETALAYLVLGNVLWTEGAPTTQVIAHFRKSLEIFEEINDQQGIADALVWLCFAHRTLGEFHASMQCGKKALAIFTQMDNRVGIAFAQLSLAASRLSACDFPAAMQFAEESGRLAAEIDIRYMLAHARFIQGDAALVAPH
jgi:tetratricopeptide (TPR) repeat protein